MDRFHLIPEAAAILTSKGVFRQVQLYRRGEGVYAKHGIGYIRLLPNSGTSVPSILWKDLDPGEGQISTKGCYLVYAEAADSSDQVSRIAAE